MDSEVGLCGHYLQNQRTKQLTILQGLLKGKTLSEFLKRSVELV
jgi:hypothetical protein